MASNYTEEQLKNLDKKTIIRLFLAQIEQLENLDHMLQLVLEQLADLKRHRFGRSTERHETDGQILFMEIDGNIVFFNEAEAVAADTEEGQDREAAIMSAKYVNAVPLYRQAQEFARYGLNISRQNMANWTIQCADRYLAIFYDYLHERLYDYHVLQADETPVLVDKNGRDTGSKSYMWVYRTGQMCMGIARSSCISTRRRAMQAIRGNSCGISAVFVLRTVTRYTTRSKMSVGT